MGVELFLTNEYLMIMYEVEKARLACHDRRKEEPSPAESPPSVMRRLIRKLTLRRQRGVRRKEQDLHRSG